MVARGVLGFSNAVHQLRGESHYNLARAYAVSARNDPQNCASGRQGPVVGSRRESGVSQITISAIRRLTPCELKLTRSSIASPTRLPSISGWSPLGKRSKSDRRGRLAYPSSFQNRRMLTVCDPQSSD